MTRALGIAGFLLPVSTAENLWAGYTAKPLHSGYAAKTGIEAALLATRGIAGCGVEGTPGRGRGFLEIMTGQAEFERLLDRLGTHYTIRDVYFKRFPVCRHAHGAAEAAVRLAQTEDYRVEDIVRVEVWTYELAASLLNRYPNEQSNLIACQFSIPFVVAAGLVHRRLGISQLSETAIHDPRVLALARRVSVAADAHFTARYPDVTPARVEVVLKDGRIMREEVEMPKGDPRAPLSEQELLEKFRDLAGLVLTPPAVDQVADAVLHLEQLRCVEDLLALMEPK
jgi:2-methylcitrate dehydratase PrpD